MTGYTFTLVSSDSAVRRSIARTVDRAIERGTLPPTARYRALRGVGVEVCVQSTHISARECVEAARSLQRAAMHAAGTTRVELDISDALLTAARAERDADRAALEAEGAASA